MSLARGKPLTRKTPLKRSRMKRKAPRRVAKATPEEREYNRWLHEEEGPCVGSLFIGHRCSGVGEASHERNPVGRMTGMAMKESYLRQVRKCSGFHSMWGASRGPFALMSKQERKAWMSARIAEHHARYEMETGSRLGGQP